jgi:uncharacterized integral membrane protein
MVERERVDAPDTDQIPVQTDVPPVRPRTAPDGETATEVGTGGGTPDAGTADAGPGTGGAVEPAGPGSTAGTTAAPRATDPLAPSGDPAYRKVRRTRFSGLWVGATVAALVLLVLLVFIIQNSQTVNISFFGAHGHLSLGVALLLAAIAGVLLVAVPGYGRILQLRRALRRTGVGKARAS